jgi:signal transduction histidine kinase
LRVGSSPRPPAAATTQQISDTDLTRRIPVHGRDDISELATTFNAMLDRLEESFATQRRFLDDIGHELRTPITIIRGHLELMSLSNDPTGTPRRRRLCSMSSTG